jgi:hypothetical protein
MTAATDAAPTNRLPPYALHVSRSRIRFHYCPSRGTSCVTRREHYGRSNASEVAHVETRFVELVNARRVLSADRRGSSWPALVETDSGLRFVKLRGAGQRTGPLVAEIIVGSLAEAIGLSVPERSLVRIPPAVPSLDRDGELAELLTASEGVNLGFSYLDGARPLSERELAEISDDDAAAILWLDWLVMNPDRTARNPNLVWWHDRMWLIDHGAALGFQYAWDAVIEEGPRRPFLIWEPHVLHDRDEVLAQWDEIFAARLTRETIEEAVAAVPDTFLEPLLSASDLSAADVLSRRRAAYVAYLWKRLKAPRDFRIVVASGAESRRRSAPAWLTRRNPLP